MADFRSWSHHNLVRFCEEYESDRNKMIAANIALANEKAAVLNALEALMLDYKNKASIYCFTAEKQEAYIAAQRIAK